MDIQTHRCQGLKKPKWYSSTEVDEKSDQSERRPLPQDQPIRAPLASPKADRHLATLTAHRADVAQLAGRKSRPNFHSRETPSTSAGSPLVCYPGFVDKVAQPIGSSRTEHIASLSFEELAAQQGVTPVDDFETLLGARW